MLLFLIIWLISVFFLTRTVLLVTGLLKGPILARFEKYGDHESFPPLLTPFLGWAGAFVALSNLLLAMHWNAELNWGWLGLVGLAMALIAYRWPSLMGGRYGLVLNHPSWLAELVGRTTRAERRRLAYMWLRLPAKLRLIYNSNDRAFMEWADMVILSTFWP
jgi:hypothetical protein